MNKLEKIKQVVVDNIINYSGDSLSINNEDDMKYVIKDLQMSLKLIAKVRACKTVAQIAFAMLEYNWDETYVFRLFSDSV